MHSMILSTNKSQNVLWVYEFLKIQSIKEVQHRNTCWQQSCNLSDAKCCNMISELQFVSIHKCDCGAFVITVHFPVSYEVGVQFFFNCVNLLDFHCKMLICLCFQYAFKNYCVTQYSHFERVRSSVKGKCKLLSDCINIFQSTVLNIPFSK